MYIYIYIHTYILAYMHAPFVAFLTLLGFTTGVYCAPRSCGAYALSPHAAATVTLRNGSSTSLVASK
jgi:hypothetical protein